MPRAHTEAQKIDDAGPAAGRQQEAGECQDHRAVRRFANANRSIFFLT